MQKQNSLALSACLLLFSCGSGEKPSNPPPSGSCENKSNAALAFGSGTYSRFLLQIKKQNGRSFRDAENRAVKNLGSDMAAERIADGLLLLQSPAPMRAAEIEARMDPESVAFIEPDYEVYAVENAESPLTADPLLSKQWAHSMVHSKEAWSVNRGSRSVIVAVIDSGIDATHPDLAPNLWKNPGEIPGNGIDDDGNGLVDDVNGWNFASNTANILADDSPSFHGTHVAGTIGAAGNNGIGISGHAQEVRLLTVKFLKSNGAGSSSDAIKGIDYAIRAGAKVISNSWGSRNYSQALAQAIRRAEQAGVIFVAAAGNNGTSNDQTAFYPANYPGTNMISVAASTSADKLASFPTMDQSTCISPLPGRESTPRKMEIPIKR